MSQPETEAINPARLGIPGQLEASDEAPAKRCEVRAFENVEAKGGRGE